MLHGKYICVGRCADIRDCLIEEPAVYKHVIVITALLLQMCGQTSPLLFSLNMWGMFGLRIPHMSTLGAVTCIKKKRLHETSWSLMFPAYLTTAHCHHPPLPSVWPKTVTFLLLNPDKWLKLRRGGAYRNALLQVNQRRRDHRQETVLI